MRNSEQALPWRPTALSLLLFVVLPLVAVPIGLIGAEQPKLLFAGVLAVPLLFLIRRLPDMATLFAVFVLYTNAAVVAVRFHGIPGIVGMAFPLVLLLPLFHHCIIRREKLILSSPLNWLILFALVQTVGAVFSAVPDEALGVMLIFVTEGIGTFVLMTNLVRTPQMLRWSVWALMASGVFMGALTVLQFATTTYGNNYGGFAQVAAEEKGFVDDDGQIKQKRQAGPLGSQNRYAQNLLMLLPLAMMCGRSTRRHRYSLVFIGVMLTIGAAAALTQSRGGAVGFAATLAVGALLRYVRLRHIGFIAAGCVVLLGFMPAFQDRLVEMQQNVLPVLMGEKQHAIRDADSSARGRFTEMLAAGWMFADHPVLGVGPGMYRRHYVDYARKVGIKFGLGPRQPHTLYLGIAAESGMLGLLCFLVIVGVVLHKLYRVRKLTFQTNREVSNLAAGFLLAIVVYLTTGLFLHFTYIRYFWVVMGLAAATAHIGLQQAHKGTQDLEPCPV